VDSDRWHSDLRTGSRPQSQPYEASCLLAAIRGLRSEPPPLSAHSSSMLCLLCVPRACLVDLQLGQPAERESGERGEAVAVFTNPWQSTVAHKSELVGPRKSITNLNLAAARESFAMKHVRTALLTAPARIQSYLPSSKLSKHPSPSPTLCSHNRPSSP